MQSQAPWINVPWASIRGIQRGFEDKGKGQEVSAKVHVHKTYHQFTNGLGVVEVQGSTVGECLKDLVRQYPAMEKSVFTKNGKLNPVVEIYVNAESAYPDELGRRVKEGDDIHITLMLAGG